MKSGLREVIVDVDVYSGKDIIGWHQVWMSYDKGKCTSLQFMENVLKMCDQQSGDKSYTFRVVKILEV